MKQGQQVIGLTSRAFLDHLISQWMVKFLFLHRLSNLAASCLRRIHPMVQQLRLGAFH